MNSGNCPICNSVFQQPIRYPTHICNKCCLTGTFYDENCTSKRPDDYEYGDCYIKNILCEVFEGRFGNTIVIKK